MVEKPPSGLMYTGNRPEAIMTRGAGSWLWDADGKRYLDLVQGWAVNCLGHAPPVLRAALCAQAEALWNPSPAYFNDRQRELADGLIESCALDRVFFCNSGAEANEGAVKLARKWGRRNRDGAACVITTAGSFHGRTLAMMAASGKPGFSDRFPPAIDGFEKVPFGDAAAVRAAISDNTVAVMVEPVQGEAGVIVPPEGYLTELRETCDRYGVLLVFDEIQTGMGRTGPLFRHQHEDATPDIMTLGKGMGGGAPLAAMLCREAVASFEPGDQGGTFNGNPLMCAVGVAVLSELRKPEQLAHRTEQARTLRAGLLALVKEGLGTATRGAGMLQALVLPEASAAAACARAFEQGLLIQAPQPNVLRLMPALNIEAEELAEGLLRLRAALAA